MKTLAKAFITVSIILFSVSLTGPGSEFLWGFLKPLSALLFIAFFITNLLATEYAKYDEEQEYRMASAGKSDQRRMRPSDSVVVSSGRVTYATQTRKTWPPSELALLFPLTEKLAPCFLNQIVPNFGLDETCLTKARLGR